MKYCKKCLQPNTRPNIKFTENGICPACNYHELMKKVDWDERLYILKDVIKQFPKKNNNFFDCIIGVSGGKDSTRQAIWVRDKLGLNPLLVCLGYPPQQITQRGVDNISNLINLGFDTVFTSPQPKTWRKIVKEGFLQFTNWAKGTEIALISSVPRLAVKYEIPLILWGENPGLQVGDMKTVGKTGYDGNNLIFGNTVAGGDLSWLLNKGYKESDLLSFQYPSQDVFKKSKLQIVYLGWFWNDWTLVNNGMYSCAYGLKPREDPIEMTADFSKVSSLDEDWVTLNQMIKYYKFGFGRVTDYINERIRNGFLTRKEGISICEKYDGLCSNEYIESFCKYIDISVKQFWEQINQSFNKNLFYLNDKNKICKKFKVGEGL